MINIYILNIENIKSDLIFGNIESMNDGERTQFLKYKREKDIIRKYLSYKMINKIILKDRSCEIKKNKYGKPYIDEICDLKFNLSHSGEYIILAVSEKEVGIDIEKVCDLDYKDIMKSFYCTEEIQYILSKSAKERINAFYEIWTLKESYLKFIGKGLSQKLDSFCMKKISNSKFNVSCDNDLELETINIFENYKISICSFQNDFDLKIRVMNYIDLL